MANNPAAAPPAYLADEFGGGNTVLDTIDRGFELYRRGLSTILFISAVVLVPFSVLTIPLQILARQELATDPFNFTTSNTELLLNGANLLQTLVWAIVGQTMIAVAIAGYHVGQQPQFADAWRKARGRMGPLFFALMIFGFIIIALFFGGAVLAQCIIGIPFLLFAYYLALCVQAMIVPTVTLEKTGVMQAVNRAYMMGRARFWRVLNLTIVTGLITAVVYAALFMVIFLLTSPLADAGYTNLSVGMEIVAQTLVNIVVLPIYPIVYTVFYFDIRTRLEGLDVAYYLSAYEEPYPADIPTPDAKARFIRGQDLLNMLGIAGIFFGFILLIVAAGYGLEPFLF